MTTIIGHSVGVIMMFINTDEQLLHFKRDFRSTIIVCSIVSKATELIK